MRRRNWDVAGILASIAVVLAAYAAVAFGGSTFDTSTTAPGVNGALPPTGVVPPKIRDLMRVDQVASPWQATPWAQAGPGRRRDPPASCCATTGPMPPGSGGGWRSMPSPCSTSRSPWRKDATYEDLATKFFEYFTYIAVAMDDQGLWDEGDGFFYDVLHRPDGSAEAVRLLSIVSPARLVRILTGMLDEAEFLPPHRIRALSRRHAGQPYTVALGDATARVDYEPGESQTGPFGGNSNWRVRCGSR